MFFYLQTLESTTNIIYFPSIVSNSYPPKKVITITEWSKPNLIPLPEYMIKLIESGKYELVETETNLKVLMFGSTKAFLWKNSGCSGKLEYIKFDPNQICCTLSVNNYRLYGVANDTTLNNGIHLELYAGKKIWQPYLLSKGLPTVKNKKKPISKIDEVITKVRTK